MACLIMFNELEKVSKTTAKKTSRSASTIGEPAKAAVDGAGQLQLLTVQQPGQHSRSVSPRTPSTADSSSCRVPSNTGSSSIGIDAADRTLAGLCSNPLLSVSE